MNTTEIPPRVCSCSCLLAREGIFPDTFLGRFGFSRSYPVPILKNLDVQDRHKSFPFTNLAAFSDSSRSFRS